MRRFWLLPLAALIAVLPLLTGGHSCGHDFAFHMQSWLGAADQLRHGTLLPRWNFFAAYNAGEPRFLFYPPLSWLLGAVLTLLLPFHLVPTAVTWVILTVAGFSMYRLARAYAPEPIALFAACLFLANPFMLWTVTGRNAYAELLAAAFCPLLLAAMLALRPSPWRIGCALALMWLSNVPGGVIGTYVLLFIAVIRLLQAARPGAPVSWQARLRLLVPLAFTFTAALLYGLALSAVFLVPALRQRRSIHMDDAFIPPLRPIDNLFFHRVLLPGRDAFLLRTEHIYLALAAATTATLLFAWRRTRRRPAAERAAWRQAGVPATVLSLMLIVGMTFLSRPLWQRLPALWVVQFPWRSLFVLGACFALAFALFFRRSTIRPIPAALAGLLTVAILSYGIMTPTRVACTVDREPESLQADFLSHHAPEPTDEYVVATGNADFLRPDNPPFWLAGTPDEYAPGTTPNPAAADPTAEWPLPPAGARLFATPLHLFLKPPASGYLVVNLQDYPNWRITRNGSAPLAHLHRPDGLLAVALPPGPATLSITWHHSWDEYVGSALSLAALLAFLLSRRRVRAFMFTQAAA